MSFLRGRFLVVVRANRLLLLSTLVILAGFESVAAQLSTVHIRVLSSSSPRVSIEAQYPAGTDVLSFRNTYAGVFGLGGRIEVIAASKQTGESVTVKKLVSGEYKAQEEFNRVLYEVRLDPPVRAGDLSHVSWLTSERGLLMLSDLLPQAADSRKGQSSISIQFELPTGWTVASGVKSTARNEFVSDEPDQAVFLVAPSLKEKRGRTKSTETSIISSGDWPFAESAALDSIGRIVNHYTEITGFALRNRPTVILVPFPGNVSTGRWTAETRGNTVVLLLGNKADRGSTLSMLAILLTHELFHLWVPYSLALEGDYDWFFEGFTLYEALRTASTLKLISFDKYLATLARVFDSYLATADRDRFSLIDVSARRWTVGSSLVYDKGMLVAFIYDLTLRSSHSAHPFDRLYSELFRARSTTEREGNRVIMSILNQSGGMDFSERYVSGKEAANPGPLLATFGIRVDHSGNATRFLVAPALTKDQRKLLKELGYNQ